MIKVMLVDDEALVRQGLRMRMGLEPDMMVIGEANDGLNALDLAQRLDPDVVVMDLEMPRMNGVAATEWLSEVTPRISVVILSIFDDARARAEAEAAGAVAFVGKQEPIEHLLEAIRGTACRYNAAGDEGVSI